MPHKEKPPGLKIAIALYLTGSFLSALLFLFLLAAGENTSDEMRIVLQIAVVGLPISGVALSIFLWRGNAAARLWITLEWIVALAFLPFIPLLLVVPLLLVLPLGILWFEKGVNKYLQTQNFIAQLSSGIEAVRKEWPQKPPKIKALLGIYMVGEAIAAGLLLLLTFVYPMAGSQMLFFIFTAISLVELLLIYLVWKRNRWGRILGIVEALLGGLDFPIGTAVGIGILYLLLFDKDVKEYFEGN